VGLGEVTQMDGGVIQTRLIGSSGDADALLVRDARRDVNGVLRTAAAFGSGVVGFVPPPDALPALSDRVSGPRPVARVGPVTATLVNGIFGDPLLHVRFSHQRRSLLFDLGEGGRLPARIAHQVTDVFISHAHIDHVAGFLWLLRSRIGETSVCRIFGPPGIAANIAGMVAGIHWDRIGAGGPRFEVAELHGERLLRSLIQAGQTAAQALGEVAAADGILLRDASFRVRAVTLDHRTPVLAFALEPTLEIKVRKERLTDLGLPPGPWLTRLKTLISGEQHEAAIVLPDGGSRTAAELAKQLLLIQPGRKLVYATDLADTAGNRARLSSLAQGAHTIFCEAAFCEAEAAQAARTGHLTARACGEIAGSAGVRHLIPFHLSRRYEKDAGPIYAEARAACSSTIIPIGVAATWAGPAADC
jgi:ribonuclease BN (tRNA processing enzyme)